MTFSRSDLTTFAIGALAAVVITVAQALVQLESDPVTDWGTWGASLGTGILAALGRYVLTRVPEMMVPDAKPKRTAKDVLEKRQSGRQGPA